MLRLSKDLSPSDKDTRQYVLFYALGYEEAVSDYALERLQLEEERRQNQEEYRQMCDLCSSYVEKASLELRRIHGDELCDVASLRREVRELRESLTLLKCTFAILFPIHADEHARIELGPHHEYRLIFVFSSFPLFVL